LLVIDPVFFRELLIIDTLDSCAGNKARALPANGTTVCNWKYSEVHPSIHPFIHSFIHRYLTEIIAYAESFRDGQLLLQQENYQALV